MLSIPKFPVLHVLKGLDMMKLISVRYGPVSLASSLFIILAISAYGQTRADFISKYPSITTLEIHHAFVMEPEFDESGNVYEVSIARRETVLVDNEKERIVFSDDLAAQILG